MQDSMQWSETQRRRLKELGAGTEHQSRSFQSPEERNRAFLLLEKTLCQEHRSRLEELRSSLRRPELARLEQTLVETLTAEGFVQVMTPTIMSRTLLERMSIDREHPLSKQVFWLDGEHCLRPMLAPHLYYLLVDLLRLWERPVRIFEVGPCYRKETTGAQYAGEFTMLNLTEMGLPLEDRQRRLEELAALVVSAAGLQEHRLERESSVVYGETVDIVSGNENVEIGSTAMGPHELDRDWRIDVPWIGIGVGLERMLMVKHGSLSINPWKRSLSYLNGARLNV